MNKSKFETPNLTAENVTKLAALFPSVVAEGKVNFDLLRSMFGDEVFGDEAYEFTWVGKRAAIAEAGRPIRKTLRPSVEESKDWDTTKNLYIEGDNLDVLKLLQESYLGKVKMIYIDPPYNTGNDFVYRDDFSQNCEEYDKDSGAYDEEGDRLFRNTETNGRFHSDWCSMMYPRLVLARNILSKEGFIFISIGEEEIENLLKICDEIFNKHLRLGTFIWKRRQMVDSRSKSGVSEDHEYMLCYAKTNEQRLRGKETNMSKYTNPDNDPRGDWMSADMTGLATASQRPNLHYELINPKTGIIYNCPPTGWRYERKRMEELIKTEEIIFPSSPEGRPRRKKFAKDLQNDFAGLSTILETVYNTQATRELKHLFEGEDYFDFPKPVDLIKLFVKQASDQDDTILDFFSGSATTAHAVMQLNSEDGGKRKFIMVQLPEVCADGTEATKAGFKNICEVGKERIRRAGEKIKAEAGLTAQNLDIGFRVLKLDDTNMTDVYYVAGDYTQDMLAQMENNIKPGRTDMDLLFGCLLDWGLSLSVPHTHEKIDGFTVHTYNGDDLVACFEERISEKLIREIAKRQPLRAVFRDSGFSSSPAKINVFEIFKLLAPNTKVKVI